jgi:hypothetical protein
MGGSGNGTDADDDGRGARGEAGGGCAAAELRRACVRVAYWGVSEMKEPRSRSLGTALETSRRRSKAKVKGVYCNILQRVLNPRF